MTNLLLLTVFVLLGCVQSLITFEDVDHLALITTNCFKIISRYDVFELPSTNDQHVAIFEKHGNDLETVVASALSNLNSNLTTMLSVPMDVAEKRITNSEMPCSTIVREYRSFLTSTAWLLNTVDEKQQINRWTRESEVYATFSQTQALWASRRMNKQNLSFIEQQISLYRSTDCFAKNEVLRRGVEVVEYMNDILDSFL